MNGNGRPSRHGDMLVPPFYGTGDMLSWNTEELLRKVDRPKLFTAYWKTLPEPEHESLDVEFEELSHRIVERDLIDARGYYSFFPVIVEGERAVVLDASDFHSEVASIELPPTELTGSGGLGAYLRPEGATIAITAVTLGPGLERTRPAADSVAAKEVNDEKLAGLADYLVDDLVRRTAVEIRRALFLPADQGDCYPVGSPEVPGRANARAIAMLVCAEDRLGVTVSPEGAPHPPSSRLCLYLPYGPHRVGP